jgi:hypothetical protein
MKRLDDELVEQVHSYTRSYTHSSLTHTNAHSGGQETRTNG